MQQNAYHQLLCCGMQKIKRIFWIKTTALTTVICFMATTMCCGQGVVGGGEPSQIAPSALNVLAPNSLGRLPPLSAEILIPSDIGEIQQVHAGSGPLVIMIQDAHVNETAQRNIAAILKHLQKEYGLDLVMLEGAEGRLFPELFNTLPSKASRRDIADYLLQQGRLTGPEYFAVVDKPELLLVGIEDGALYEKNRQAYLQAASGASRDEPQLRELQGLLETAARYVYSEDLLALYDSKRQFEHDKGHEFTGFIQTLTRLSEKTGLSLDVYPAIRSMLKLSSLESNIDFGDLPKGFRTFIADLKSSVSEHDRVQLKKEAVAYRSGKIKKSRYYHSLEGHAEAAARRKGASSHFNLQRFDPSPHKNILRYLRFTQLSESLNASLFDELENLEGNIKEKLFVSDAERQLDHLWRVFETCGKMLGFSLTRNDARFFYENRSDFKAAVFEDFLKPILEKYKFQKGFPASLEVFDEGVENAERFYQAALQRDGALVHNALEQVKAAHSTVAALIAGGFHTPGIEAELKKQDYSYLIVTPKISGSVDSQKDEKLYDEALREKPLTVENIVYEALLSKKETPLQDPLFQLSAYHLVMNEQKGQEVLSGLNQGLDIRQDTLTSSHSGVTALAVFSAVLMHVNDLFLAEGDKTLVATRWNQRIGALQQSGQDALGFEKLRDLILKGQYLDGPEAQLFIFSPDVSIQNSRVLALKYPTTLPRGEVLALFPGLERNEIKTVDAGKFKILVLAVSADDLPLIQKNFGQMIERHPTGLKFTRSEVRRPMSRRGFLTAVGTAVVTATLTSGKSAKAESAGDPSLAPYFDLAKESFGVEVQRGTFATDVQTAAQVVLPEYEIKAPTKEEIVEHLKQMLTLGNYGSGAMDANAKKDIDARAFQYYEMIQARAGELSEILNMEDPKIPDTYFTNMLVEWLVRRDLFNFNFPNVPEPLPVLLEAIIQSAKETAEWLDFETAFNHQSLDGTYLSVASSKTPRTDSLKTLDLSGYQLKPVEVSTVRNIEDNNEVPEIFRSQIGGKVQDWTALEKVWRKRSLGGKLGVNLSTFVGISQALAMAKFNFEIDKRTGIDAFGSLKADPLKRWSAPAHFFTMLYLILNRGDELKENYPASRTRNILLDFLSSAESTHFFYSMYAKTQQALAIAQQNGASLFLGPQNPSDKPALYPYFQLPRRVYRTHIVGPEDIADAFVYSTVFPSAEIQRAVMNRDGFSGTDILEGDAPGIAAQVMVDVMNEESHSFHQLYQFHNDPVARRIYDAVMRGEFSPELGRKSRQVTLEDLKAIDLRFVSPDEESLSYYLIGLHESHRPKLPQSLVDRMVNIAFIQALIGKDAARAATWVRIGFENGYVKVRLVGEKNGKRQYDVDSSDLTKLFQDVDAILVFAEMFLGRRLNLSNPDDIGTVVSMVENVYKMGLKPEQFSMLLLLGSDRAGINRVIHDYETNPNDNAAMLPNPRIAQVKTMKERMKQDPLLRFDMQKDLAQLLSAITGDERYEKDGFSFSDPVTGADQIGFVLSFVTEQIKDGWSGADDRVQPLTATIRRIGQVQLFRTARASFQVFDEALGKEGTPFSDHFFEMSLKARGHLMAILKEITVSIPAVPVKKPVFRRSEVRQESAALPSDISLRLQKAVESVRKMTFQQQLSGILTNGKTFDQFNSTFPALLVRELENRKVLNPLADKASVSGNRVILAPWAGIETAQDLKSVVRELPGEQSKIVFSVPSEQLAAAKALLSPFPDLAAKIDLSEDSLETLAVDLMRQLGISDAVRLAAPDEAIRQNPRLAIPILGVGAELLKRSYDLIVVSPKDVLGVNNTIEISMTLLEAMVSQWQDEMASALATKQSA